MYEAIIEDVLPQALMIGVDYDLFWTLTPKSLTPFIKAFELKRNMDDEIAWQHGIYIQMAIASMLDKNTDYPDIPLSSRTIEKVEPMSKVEQMKEIMMERMAIVNSQLVEEGEIINESE